MVECIGRLIKNNKQYGRPRGIKPSLRSASFSHQQFVDDTIMGGEASVKEAKVMKDILDMYIRGSGKLINWDKRYIFFNNTPKERQRKIVRILVCGVGKLPSIYLCFPMGTKPPDYFWNGILDRFSKNLVGWKGTSLSQVGKCLLVKSTL